DYLPDYPANGIVIPDEELRARGEIKQENGKTYLYYTVPNLFPETTYHLWVRASADASEEEPRYSNPVSMTTQAMAPPDPPTRLGLASKARVDAYNTENSTAYLPIDYAYMIVEWFREIHDTAADGAAAGGEAPAGGATAEILSAEPGQENIIVKFNELIGNRPYYIRAKTRLTITKTEEGIASFYQYVVQLSPNADFTDAVELIVPPGAPEGEGTKTLSKDSAWTETIRLVTSPYQGEYDGDKNPQTVPLPEQDFELTYDRSTDTLTYRYRSDETDARGDRDNHVDQRFISTLVNSKAFNVVADVSNYNGKTVQNSVVELPYSIVKALEERKISLTVKAPDLTLTMMPGFMETNEVKALADLAPASKIKISVVSGQTGLPGAGTFVTQPKTAKIEVKTPTRTLALSMLANPYKAALKLANRHTVLDQNTAAYTFTANDAGWTRVPDGQYTNETGEISFYTRKLSAYAAIAKTVPQVAGGSSAGVYTVATKINITDMPVIDMNAAATSGQINKLMAAIALNQKEVALNGALTPEEQNALQKGGLLTTGATVPREAALSALVKLYEVKTKASIKAYATVEQSGYKDIAAAEPQYRAALLKAAELGFFGMASAANPKAPCTLGDLFGMADIIIQDAGL
ncbi:MAG: hypothetical protein LBU77_07035, partial [Clostridiales bacterium]|nr:hypothetical protein [Clostridiales bacterium]